MLVAVPLPACDNGANGVLGGTLPIGIIDSGSAVKPGEVTLLSSVISAPEADALDEAVTVITPVKIGYYNTRV
jgi:hypothetical protein